MMNHICDDTNEALLYKNSYENIIKQIMKQILQMVTEGLKMISQALSFKKKKKNFLALSPFFSPLPLSYRKMFAVQC